MLFKAVAPDGLRDMRWVTHKDSGDFKGCGFAEFATTEDAGARVDNCDDADASTNPGATEVCDDADLDENCNVLADDQDAWRIGFTRTNPDTGFEEGVSGLHNISLSYANPGCLWLSVRCAQSN